MYGVILGGKNRVQGTLHPISGSVHLAYILARILALLLWGNGEKWGMMKREFCGFLPTTSLQE